MLMSRSRALTEALEEEVDEAVSSDPEGREEEVAMAPTLMRRPLPSPSQLVVAPEPEESVLASCREKVAPWLPLPAQPSIMRDEAADEEDEEAGPVEAKGRGAGGALAAPPFPLTLLLLQPLEY